ncbi:hypothetical protein PF005_g29737 [Phytophthora fragariae]|uniref:BED-type domain-containing protein n=1 Tax=Phytophthora fragariae TaxID=53985 RepID=A0A6A3VH53_9STRA|nr:hypothetical protein PF003_g17469 [Phytophthora fragariae]KAE8919280.1 hypothetical protein PF009_g30410 [Phytophthora fragariae]KAE8988830.1 hypothetical protein PF011_g19016 [Phytophthora fragariae]KAE9061769.1 hypothetical protein PF010_g29691 [Phytophthora fragariae]KAE9063335.1 hypothetical protein PF007_g29586 [Phytophthora fragariae]
MYKIKKQHRKEMWGFIRLVRDDRFAEIPKKELHSDHARCAYCMVCEEEITYTTGNTTAVGRHMNKFHEKVLVNFQKRLAAKRSSTGVALSSGCACSTTGSSTELVVDITPEQQGHVDKLLAVWVAKSLRPFSIVEDAGLVELIRYLTKLALAGNYALVANFSLVANYPRIDRYSLADIGEHQLAGGQVLVGERVRVGG